MRDQPLTRGGPAGRRRSAARGRRGFFDAHLHADGLSDADLESMVRFGLTGALIPARDAVCGGAKELLAHFEEVLLEQASRLTKLGVRPYAALGVHPARIPWHGLEEVLSAIPRLAERGRLVAIGQIGLEKGSAREEQVFERQLELAAEVNLPVLVGTPERDKPRMTRRALAILRHSGLPPSSVLVDGADRRTLPTIRACGFWAGLSVNPARLSAEEAVELIGRFGAESFILSSDAGDGANDILALARTAALLEAKELGAPIIGRVLKQNALSFLRL